MALTQPQASALAGTQLGRYTLLGKLAMGGMAEVFLARQEGPMGFAKTVVVKRILPQFAQDQEFLQMFLDEARLAALINHPNVVQIYELGEDPDTQTYYMAMEYIDGRNLRQVATRALELGTQLSTRVAVRLIADAAAGLDFAHHLKSTSGQPLNIVHRDISAENVLVSYAGLAKVVDFGIAKAANIEGRTRTGQVKGKFGYMAPEQLLGQPIDRRADVWALGITLYWLLSGHRPFRGDSEGQIIQQVVSAPLPPLQRRGTAVPPDLQEIVARSLEKSPARRFQSAGELREALDGWIADHEEPVSQAALGALMEQLFPERTDKDRVLTAALLQGEIKPQDTPWQSRLAKQQKPTASQLSQLAPRARPPWLLPAVAVGAALLASVVGLITLPLLRAASELPPAEHHSPVVVVPALTPEAGPTKVAPPPAPAGAAPVSPEPTPAPVHAAAEPERHRAGGRPHHAESEEKRVGPPGQLTIDIRPWAAVTIDGRRLGTTPMRAIELPPGKHRVELDNADLGVHLVRTVDMKSGEAATLREKLVDRGE